MQTKTLIVEFIGADKRKLAISSAKNVEMMESEEMHTDMARTLSGN